MSKFKVGDKVYCPHFSTGILTLVQSEKSNNLLAFEYCNKSIDVTKDGKIWDSQGLVADIFHATIKKNELLSKLYPTLKFEEPKALPISKEVVKMMLNYGYKSVCCYISNHEKNPNSNNRWDYIILISDGYLCRSDGEIVDYATPFDPKTGKIIIDFNSETGEVILEKEDE